MNIRCVLNLVVEHLVVRLLIVAHELIDVLINLNCRREASIFIMELNVVFARLLILSHDLNGVTLGLEDLRCLVGHRLILLAGLDCPSLPRVHIDVEVLASLSVIVPA